MRWVFIFFSSFSWALPTTQFECQTNPRTTGFKLVEAGEEMLLIVTHYNGVDYMPVHEGIIVPHDLKYLTDVSTLLKHMGMVSQFRFPQPKCKKFADGVVNCSSGETKTFDGVTMQALSLNTQKVTTQVFSDKVEEVRVVLSLNIKDFTPVQEISMVFSPEDCHFN